MLSGEYGCWGIKFSFRYLIRFAGNVERYIALESMTWPECMSCEEGHLVPLSDFGAQGAAVHYKAWVCTNPDCEYNLKIRNGEIHVNEPIIRGARVR